MPGIPWWTVLAGLSEAAKLAREFSQRKRGAGRTAGPAYPSSPPPGASEIDWLNSRLCRLEQQRDEDNQFTARLGEELQGLAELLIRIRVQLKTSLIVGGTALAVTLLTLVLLALK